MNRQQRHVLVVASGVAIGAVTEAAVRSVRQPAAGGWFNWSPDSGVTMSHRGERAHALRVAGIRLAGVACWTAIAWSVYRDQPVD